SSRRNDDVPRMVGRARVDDGDVELGKEITGPREMAAVRAHRSADVEQTPRLRQDPRNDLDRERVALVQIEGQRRAELGAVRGRRAELEAAEAPPARTDREAKRVP